MKILIAAVLFLLLPAVSLAATYPATCPAEAQAVVNAIGGCAVIDCDQYTAICGKCCAENLTPTTQAAGNSADTTGSLTEFLVGLLILVALIYFAAKFSVGLIRKFSPAGKEIKKTKPASTARKRSKKAA